MKEALAAVERLLADRLGLSLSAEKTKVTRFHEGFSFLPLRHQVPVREDASQALCVNNVENFKTKVRRITRRSHNLDAEVPRCQMTGQLNRVIRGPVFRNTANYFATPWSHCGDMYRSLDRWIRMRLRCMKFKRKSQVDNVRIRLKHFRHMGLLSLSDLRASCVARSISVPLVGAISTGPPGAGNPHAGKYEELTSSR